MNDEGVYRTAPATPGLLFIIFLPDGQQMVNIPATVTSGALEEQQFQNGKYC